MALDPIWTAIVSKTAGVQGVKRAERAVAGTPRDSGDAVVLWEGSDLVAGSPERLSHRFAIRYYQREPSPGSSLAALAAAPARFVTAWRTNTSLGGLVRDCVIEGFDGPDVETVGNQDFHFISVRVVARESAGVTYSAT